MGACNELAFHSPRVELRLHNASVGAAVYILFRDRLGALGERSLAAPLNRAAGIPGALLASAVLAGALHDVGKASPLYRGKQSYYGHELAGAVLLQRAAEWLESKGMRGEAVLLELAAWAVARHHSAMKDRHPVDAANLPGPTGRAAGALAELLESPECALKALPPLPGWVRDAVAGALYDLSDRAAAQGKGWVMHLLKEKLWMLAGRQNITRETPSTPEGIPAGRWMVYASIATGAVVVADTLVASAERRAGEEAGATDEAAGPAYVELWRAELDPGAVRRVEDLAKRGAAGGPEPLKALEQALASLGMPP
ncbi:HD domain-containing protein [Stetteria hydrogenophila]